MTLKFMPQMPAKAVATAKIPAHAARRLFTSLSSIATIDSAIAEARRALEVDPASRFLSTQLNKALEKKLGLLRTAALLPSRT